MKLEGWKKTQVWPRERQMERERVSVTCPLLRDSFEVKKKFHRLRARPRTVRALSSISRCSCIPAPDRHNTHAIMHVIKWKNRSDDQAFCGLQNFGGAREGFETPNICLFVSECYSSRSSLTHNRQKLLLGDRLVFLQHFPLTPKKRIKTRNVLKNQILRVFFNGKKVNSFFKF